MTVRLSVEDKQAIKETVMLDEDVYDFIQRYVENGYKLSMSIDTRNDSYIVSMTGKKEGTENYNRCLSSRGPSLAGAFTSLAYKLRVYCPGGVFPLSDTPDSDLWG